MIRGTGCSLNYATIKIQGGKQNSGRLGSGASIKAGWDASEQAVLKASQLSGDNAGSRPHLGKTAPSATSSKAWGYRGRCRRR